jgi:hypothetical protein
MVAEIDFRDMTDVGATEFVVSAMHEVGLEPDDFVQELTPERPPRGVVREVIQSLSTTDPSLLQQLREAIAQRLESQDKTVLGGSGVCRRGRTIARRALSHFRR